MEDKLAVDIVEQVGCLPLLIITTGCQIRNREYRPQEVLQLFKNKYGARDLAVSDSPPEDRASDILAHFTGKLRTPLKSALANLNEIPGHFSIEEAASVLGHSSAALVKLQVILPLASRHVITYNRKENRMDITPVIREFIGKNFVELKDPDVLHRFCSVFEQKFERVLSAYHKDPKTAMNEIAQDFLKYRKFLREYQCQQPETFSRVFQLLQTGQTELILLFPKDTEHFLNRIVDAGFAYGDKRQQARLMMGYGCLLGFGLGRHKESNDALIRARQFTEAFIDPSQTTEMQEEDTVLLAKLYHHLGSNYLNLGRREEALKILGKSQDLLQRCQQDERTKRIISGNDSLLGMTYTEIGEYELAEKHHLLAIQVRRSLREENHPYIGMSFNNLADAYSSQGNWEKAMPLYEKSLKIKRMNSGGIATDTVTETLNSIAKYHFTKGTQDDLNTALGMVKEALDMRRELRWKHYVTSGLRKLEGQIYMAQGKAELAKESLCEAVAIRRDIFGRW